MGLAVIDILFLFWFCVDVFLTICVLLCLWCYGEFFRIPAWAGNDGGRG